MVNAAGVAELQLCGCAEPLGLLRRASSLPHHTPSLGERHVQERWVEARLALLP